uniref:Cytochrome b-c1 complex subunit 7 n=1 Tax=Cebus imitator TaxID=2715852 RepID=A0A2K5RGI9_CEBIM
MAGRLAVSASSRLLEIMRKWYYNAAGFNKPGLLRDNTMYENEDVKEAIRRLPENLYNDRMFRIKRENYYLEPHLKEVIRERKEREEWEKK